MTLRDRLIARIRARGPISFADYMAAALYDPDDGYYSSRVALGFEGDYLTAPDLGAHFGRSLTRGFVDLWTQLVEVGPGYLRQRRRPITRLNVEAITA